MMSACKCVLAAALLAMTFAASSQAAHAAEPAIKLGNTAPYSGPASAYGTIARAEAAYFQMLNDQGGINGRRIEFLTLDDGYSPAKTVEQTRKLVEQDDVLAMFSSVGTAPNISVQKYLNVRGVPQIFVSSGATRWNDPEHFPWTVGFNPTYELEGRLYAEYILQTKPNAKIAVIAPNEDAGKDYVRGFKAGLGEHIDQLVSETTYLTADPTIDSQMVTMRESGADVFFAEATPKFAAQAIRKAASMGWDLPQGPQRRALGGRPRAERLVRLDEEVPAECLDRRSLQRAGLHGSADHGAGVEELRRRSFPRQHHQAGEIA
jgi:branched-chain amino acid transport system substrate-binding protein